MIILTHCLDTFHHTVHPVYLVPLQIKQNEIYQDKERERERRRERGRGEIACLSVNSSRFTAGRLHRELAAEDVTELGSVAISSSRHLPLFVVVVGRGQQRTEDQLGDVHLLRGMHLDRNAAAIVPHTDEVVFSVMERERGKERERGREREREGERERGRERGREREREGERAILRRYGYLPTLTLRGPMSQICDIHVLYAVKLDIQD